MKCDVEVRPALESDWPQFRPFLANDKPIDSDEAAFERFCRKINSPLHCVLVAVVEGDIVGIAMAHQWDEFIMSGRKQIRFATLNVKPTFRRRGIGMRLFEEVQRWAERVGATWLEWYASPDATEFYERLGYTGTPDANPNHLFFEIEFGET